MVTNIFNLFRKTILSDKLILVIILAISINLIVNSQQQDSKSLTWMTAAKESIPETAWYKIPSQVRTLINAPKEYLTMSALLIDIKNIESDKPEIGLLVKYKGDVQSLKSKSAKVTSSIGDIYSLRIPIENLLALASDINVLHIEPSLILKPTLDNSLVENKADQVHQGDYGVSPPTYSGYTGDGVIVGIVDSGIDWEHEDFINDNDGSSRIVYLWDQTLTKQSDESNPSGYNYGVEYIQSHINDEIDGSPTNYVRSIDEVGHGTHVAGIVAGDGSATGGGIPNYTYVGMAPQAEILVVKTGFTTTEVIDGVVYAMDKAAAAEKPVVINLSLGTQGGPHDGTSLFDQALDDAINTGNVIIVASAGNEGTDASHEEYIHANNTVTSGNTVTTTFTVPSYTPNSSGGNDVIIIDMWYQGNDNNTVTITTPDGYTWYASTGSDRGNTFTSTPDGAIYIDNSSSGANSENGDRECYIQIWDYYSYYPPEDGTWTITVDGNTINESGHYDMWIAISQLGHEQAFFTAASGSNREVIGSPGSAEKIITVAAHSTKTSWIDYSGTPQVAPGAILNDLAYFSSAGPTRDDPGYITGRQKPDLSASGFGVTAARSEYATSFNNSIYQNEDDVHMIMWGTSMSAPHVTGAIALMLEKDPSLMSDDVKTHLQNSASTDAFTGSVPNYNWGYGKLDIYEAMQQFQAPDYAIKLNPLEFSMFGAGGDTVSTPLKIKNLGSNTDSYDLSVSGNNWTTTIWDASETSEITNTGNLSSREQTVVVIKTIIPAEELTVNTDNITFRAISVGDPSVSAESIGTVSKTGLHLPWLESFETATFDPSVWQYFDGPAEINSDGLNPPSSPYSLNLDGNTLGGDLVQTWPLNLSEENNIQLSYNYQMTGGGNSPETGDDLWVEYYNSSGIWVTLNQHLGSGTDMTTFTLEEIFLPTDAYHEEFMLRFRNVGTAGDYDDWFIDDVALGTYSAPDIDVTPVEFNLSVVFGGSKTRTLTIANTGDAALDYEIRDFETGQSKSSSIDEIDKILRSNLEHSKKLLGSAAVSDGVKMPEKSVQHVELFNVQELLENYSTKASNTIKACVLDGFGTYSSNAINTWNHLNSSYSSYGSTPVLIDYTTLDKDNITYNDLVNSGADVLIISDNWGYWTDGGLSFYLSTSECQAVAQYVNEGHGLLMTAGTLGNDADNPEVQPQVTHLASLVGLSSAGTYKWGYGVVADPMYSVILGSKLLTNLSDPYMTAYDYTAVPSSNNWNGMITDGEVHAISTDNQTTIIAKSNRVYCSTLAETETNSADRQFIYNAIVFGGFSDAEWISYNTNSGTISAGSNENITVTFDAANLTDNTVYSAVIQINSNDPDQSQITIPVSLNVSSEIINEIPEIINLSDFSFVNTQTLSIDLDTCVYDADDAVSAMTWVITPGNSNVIAAMSGNVIVFLCTDDEYSGTLDVKFKVTDPADDSDSITVSCMVTDEYVNSIQNSITQPYVFEMVYPNPFNEELTLRFLAPKNTDIIISSYLISGEQATQLFKGHVVNQPQSVTVNTTSWPQGIYIIKMTADNFIQMQRCVLIK